MADDARRREFCAYDTKGGGNERKATGQGAGQGHVSLDMAAMAFHEAAEIGGAGTVLSRQADSR
jgi:hypothetical protein